MTRRDLLKSMAAGAAVSAAEAMFPGVLFGARGHREAHAGSRRRRRLEEDAVPVLRGRLRTTGGDQQRPRRRREGRPREPRQPRALLREGLSLGDGALRQGPAHPGAGAEGRQARPRPHEGGPRPRRVEDGGDHQGPRQGRGGHVRLGPVDHPRRLRRVQVHEGRHRHQQPRGQRPALHVERGHGLHDELRPGRADGLLRRHRPRRHVRAVGQQHGRDAPGPVLPPPRPAAEEPRRQDHRPRHALDAHQHGRRPEHPVPPPDRPRHRQRHLPRDHSGTTGCTRASCATTCPSTRARPTSATASRTSSPSRTSRRPSRSSATASSSPTIRRRRWSRCPACPRASSATSPRSTRTRSGRS